MNEHVESSQTEWRNDFSGQEVADSLVSEQSETASSAASDKAEVTRQELIKAGVEDRFSMLDVPQPDGRTMSVLGSDKYRVMRTDGRIEDGWQTHIVGNNIIMTKTDDGKEIHKTMPKKEWFVMQAKILAADKQAKGETSSDKILSPMDKQRAASELRYDREEFYRRFNSLMATSETAIDMADKSPVKELSTEQDLQVVEFGRIRMNLKDLIESPQIASELCTLKNSQIRGHDSIDVAYEMKKVYESGQYDEAKERDPINISMVKLENGKTTYRLNGGRHRIAAATIAHQTEIEVDLTTRKGYLDDKLIEDLKSQQIHSEKSDKRRENTRKYYPDVLVI